MVWMGAVDGVGFNGEDTRGFPVSKGLGSPVLLLLAEVFRSCVSEPGTRRACSPMREP